jgi:hypothetical protein
MIAHTPAYTYATLSFHQSVPPPSPEDKAVAGVNITRDLLQPTRTVQPRVSFKTIANRTAPHKKVISCDKLAPYRTHRSANLEYYTGQQRFCPMGKKVCFL